MTVVCSGRNSPVRGGTITTRVVGQFYRALDDMLRLSFAFVVHGLRHNKMIVTFTGVERVHVVKW